MNDQCLAEIALVHPDIPQNTGNIGRLCLALGYKLHLVHPLGFVLDHKLVKRAGLDYWEHVDVLEHASLEAFLAAHSNRRLWLFSTKGQNLYSDVVYKPHDILVFGAESRGLPESLLHSFPEQILTLPMPGPVRSLNVSNCAAVAAYEVHRQLKIL